METTYLSAEDSLLKIFHKATDLLKRAGVDRKHPFRIFGLSTWNGAEVSSRNVVLRKVEDSLSVWVYTDSRSGKMEALRQFPQASLLFYDPKKRVQLRMKAKADIHLSGEKWKQHWQSASQGAVFDFQTSLPPGTQINLPEEGWNFNQNAGSRHFAVLEFTPSEIEALQLGKGQHLRASFQFTQNEWKGKWLVP